MVAAQAEALRLPRVTPLAQAGLEPRPAHRRRPRAQAPNPWQVSGYQFDMSSANNFTGSFMKDRAAASSIRLAVLPFLVESREHADGHCR